LNRSQSGKFEGFDKVALVFAKRRVDVSLAICVGNILVPEQLQKRAEKPIPQE